VGLPHPIPWQNCCRPTQKTWTTVGRAEQFRTKGATVNADLSPDIRQISVGLRFLGRKLATVNSAHIRAWWQKGEAELCMVCRPASFGHGRLRVLGGQWDWPDAVAGRTAQRRLTVQRRRRLPSLAQARHVPGYTRPPVFRRRHQHHGDAGVASSRQHRHVTATWIRRRVLQSRDRRTGARLTELI